MASTLLLIISPFYSFPPFNNNIFPLSHAQGFPHPGLENPSSQGWLSGPLIIYKLPMPRGEVTKGHLPKEFLFIFLSLYP